MRGKLIVIEGLDGSGKATQTQFLYDRIKGSRNNIIKVSFPNYEDNTSALVKMYLNGKLGSVSEVNAYAASTFFSVDRYATFQMYYQYQFNQGFDIIADRYTTSNMVHQASKLPRSEWGAYIDWLEDMEYNRMQLPQPDLVLYLDMEPEVARKLLENRYKGTSGQMDIHEADFDYMLKCREAALFAAERCGWKIIACSDDGKPNNAYEVSEKIWSIYSDLLG